MNSRLLRTAFTPALGLALVALPCGLSAQSSRGFSDSEAILRREHPEIHALLLRTERMHGLVLGKLAGEGKAVQARADKLPTPGFAFDMLEQLGVLATEDGSLEEIAATADAGYATLGKSAAGIIAWTNEFSRAVLGILADPAITDLRARRAAIDEAIVHYRSRPEAALPGLPKNMDVLYDHEDALAFRTRYANLDGFIWAGHWLRLATTKPLVDLTGAERAAGLDTVTARYVAKLSYGEPPRFFPSELPLAPAIAPELGFISPETVAIWDNLTMMEEVLADILASPNVDDERAAIDRAVTFFLDDREGIANPLQFLTMALRHGIFFQGGYPLAVMTKSELNAGGHAAHLRGGGSIRVPGM